MAEQAVRRTRSIFGNFNRNFRTIGLRQPGLVLEPFGNRAVADLMRVAVLVELEQFGRQRFAAGMTLALVLVDVNFQFSGHLRLLPRASPRRRSRAVLAADYSRAQGSTASAQIGK